MIYCKFKDCPFKRCESHPGRMPECAAVTEEGLETLRRECSFFQYKEADEKFAEEEKKLQERIRHMTYGDALALLRDIGKADTPDELKGAAIRKAILDMETHNGVTKDLMVNVIRYLFNLCFEEMEG